MSCNKCHLFKTCKTPCIQGTGLIPSDIMLLGEGPGSEEDIEGKPFVGTAGKRLDIILKETGLDRSKLYISNIVKCRPPDNRIPEPEEIKACFPYLEEEIKKVKPKIIVPLGGVALQAIQNLVGITKYAGGKYWNEKYNCWIMPTFHPAYICRNLGMQETMIDHLKNVIFWLKNPVEPEPSKYITINTIEKAQKFFDRLNKVEIFAFDIETSGLDFRKDKILCCSFSWKERTAITLPILQQHNQEFWKAEEKSWIIEQLKKILESNICKIGQNLAFDIKFLKSNGIELNNYMFDTLLAHHLLDENVGVEGHGLDTMVLRYFPDMGNYWVELEKCLETKNTSYSVIPNEVLWKYASEDADATFRCYNRFKPELEKQELMRLFNKITMPFQKILLETEYYGVKLDIEKLEKLKVEYAERLKKIEGEFKATYTVKATEQILYNKEAEKIKKRYNGLKSKRLSEKDYIKKYAKSIPFNLRSSVHLQILLFDVLEFTPTKKTKKGKISTDAEVLDGLIDKSPELVKLKEHRDLSKLYSAYIVAMLEKVDENGRIHTNYNVAGTVTGRLSSNNPNLQNIPRALTEEDLEEFENQGRMAYGDIKDCFIVDSGCILLGADFVQMEYRCWASYINCSKMIGDINKGIDIHKEMASIVNNKKVEEVTKKERYEAKSAVFGLILYGQTAKGFALKYNTTEEKANGIKEAFFNKYRKARDWVINTKRIAQKYGKVINAFGRIRRLPTAQIPWKENMEKHDARDRGEALRQALNSPVQAMATDIVAITTIRINKRLKQLNSKTKLVLQVHDELVYEVPKEEQESIIKIIKEEVARGYDTLGGKVRVPMGVDIKVGESWGKLIEIT